MFLERCAAAGVGNTLLPGALAVIAMQSAAAQVGPATAGGAAPAIETFPPITPAMLDQAAAVAGISLTDEQKAMMLDGVRTQRAGLQAVRDLHLPNSVAPALVFNPMPVGAHVHTSVHEAWRGHPRAGKVTPDVTSLVGNEDKLAFATVRQLAELLRTRKVTSVELTKLYLQRTKRLDPVLHLLITSLDERALAQAAAADREIAAGKYKGPLHGIPWGAKDLLSVKGYPTTWGAGGMEQQQFDVDATVVQRLDAAGAVLISKLTLGALAQGDVWFGGRTRNPWNPKQGSSGSSAGPASAVAAGCCGFAIGSETLGSISSPSTRCGVTGLRPTFGFVPRTGAMALSWSMDKLGPICRGVDDAGIVMQAIHGPDGLDKSVRDAEFFWDDSVPALKTLRVGYLKSAFDEPVLRTPDASAEKPETEAARRTSTEQRQRAFERQRYDNRYDRATLDVLRGMGVNLSEVKLPDFPYGSVSPVLSVEAAAAFDELTRTGRDKLLTAQAPGDWPNTFRIARMYSGVDYVQAMRARSVLIEKMAELFHSVDVIVTPSGGAQLTATNLSGHPAVIMPNGVRGNDAPQPQDNTEGGRGNVGGPGTPVSITFLGQLYDDARLLAFAQMYQEKTGFHKLHPAI
jgi:Asp-tRNA(Asn)/Glu-tRNA(Gln) amidotransferase A subunit family amidase